ncbi:hypothetical protein BJ684DRAFT_17497 [Piptocephalis cylindrospora]|uniref:Uncharacterized protein n=1 Tax=Piptocephalis cylindrospora TaxID=1907219 RepID=A0A4P9Y2A0_9FUNG|nr:hypothetical protein BJ684DRAFT_17497 [Piptocephalis cylindrospora]|eukprot:RKP11970.1 hypothetical protein BJ684DRAFT_17497 [Piptocephalis cylindrospora]
MHILRLLNLLSRLFPLRLCVWLLSVFVFLSPILFTREPQVLCIPYPHPLPEGEEGDGGANGADAPDNQGGASTESIADGEISANREKAWWELDIQSSFGSPALPLGIAMMGAATDVAFQTLLTQKKIRQAKNRQMQEGKRARAYAAHQKKRQAAAAAMASERQAFEAQQLRIAQQAILDLYLQEQKVAINEYIDRQLKWEAHRRWILDPQIQKVIYTRDTFSQLLGRNDTSGVLFALFMKTQPGRLPSFTEHGAVLNQGTTSLPTAVIPISTRIG